MGQHISSLLTSHEDSFLQKPNSGNLSRNQKGLSPGYFTNGIINSSSKLSNPIKTTELNEIYSNIELSEYYKFWKSLNSKTNSKTIINYKLFKLYLGFDKNYLPESLEWLSATLFSTLWCLKEYFYGVEVGNIHAILSQISNACPFNNDLINQIYLSKTDLLISLSVFLFDRPLHLNFHLFEKSRSQNLNFEEAWILRIKLIMAAMIESQDNFVEKFISKKNSLSIETHLQNALESSILSESQNLQSEEETEFSTTLVEGSDSIEVFIEMLKKAEREALEFNQPLNLLQLNLSHLELLVQSLYCLDVIKGINSEYTKSDLKTDFLQSPVFLSKAKTLDIELKYIADFVESSINKVFPGKFLTESKKNIELNLLDLIKWVKYCGIGIFIPLSNFLVYKILKVPSFINTIPNFDLNNYDFATYDGYEPHAKLHKSSDIISDPAFFLLSMKALPSEDSCKFRSIEAPKSHKIDFVHSIYSYHSNLQLRSKSLHSSGPFELSFYESSQSAIGSLYSTNLHGFGMNCLSKNALHYNAPTVLFVSGKIIENIDFSMPAKVKSLSTSNKSKSGALETSGELFKAGDTVKLGIFISSQWTESANSVFGSENNFIFITEPFFMILPSTASLDRQRSRSFEKPINSSINSAKGFANSQCFCYASCSPSSGLRFGGTMNISKTSKVLSTNMEESNIFRDMSTFKIDVASESAIFVNDPFSKTQNPIYTLLDSTEFFELHISLNLIELYGLGTAETLNHQKECICFNIQDAQQRECLKMKRQSSLTAKSFGGLSMDIWSTPSLRFGGTMNISKTSKVLSTNMEESNIFRDMSTFKIDVASESAIFVNDPFSKTQNPIYTLLDSTEFFELHISLNLIELYGLGTAETLNHQKECICFNIQDAQQRECLKMKRQSSLTAKSFGGLSMDIWSTPSYK
ncbi:hypothetical protein BB561_000535 [Smittium simulii]|uniref:TLDc domain-containing protein n=1 Tax=Smittium simulii TaxID=133385 RepID=A0A2T9YYN7_9FUNG|nr:hypothetical protein BB561_000535 [Smittium simulii]